MSFKGVIFDFNGTLFWDTNFHNRAWDIFLEKHDIALTNKEKNNKIHGKNNREIIESLFPSGISNDVIDSYIYEKELIYQDLCKDSNLGLAHGTEEFIDFLKDSRIIYTIATASIFLNVKFYFKKFGLNKWFDIDKVIYDNGKRKGKPAPDYFIDAAYTIDVDIKKCVVFEDSYFGIRAAENAGVGKIIIMDSNNFEYKEWDYQKIKSFNEINKDIFEIQK